MFLFFKGSCNITLFNLINRENWQNTQNCYQKHQFLLAAHRKQPNVVESHTLVFMYNFNQTNSFNQGRKVRESEAIVAN